MSITVNIPPQELAALKQLTRLEDDAEAVTQAARQFIRMARLRELKSASGKVEFDLEWQQFEAIELAETALPK